MYTDIILSALLAVLTIAMAYLGVHVTLHPAEEPSTKRAYKLGFLVCATCAVCIVVWQGVRNGFSQRESSQRIVTLQGDVGTLNATIGGLNQTVNEVKSAQEQEKGARQQAEKDLAIIVQGTGQATRKGVMEDIKKSPLKVELKGDSPTDGFKPQIEGVTFSTKTIPSPDSQSPYALEITLQSQAVIAPFAVGFICDKPIKGTTTVVGQGILSVVGEGPLKGAGVTNPETTYGLQIREGISPTSPWVIRLIGKEPFHLLQAVRLP